MAFWGAGKADSTSVVCWSFQGHTRGLHYRGLGEGRKRAGKGGGGVGGHQKAYSAAFPLLKSASKIRKGKWLTCSQSHD